MTLNFQEGIPFTSPSYYSTVDEKTLKQIFRSDNDTEIPLLEERVKVLNEAGKVLMEVMHQIDLIYVICFVLKS